ncbi:ABC transporter permease [Streptomyces sp. NBC_01794]|uniref:ABC transporter permease n=1 Tax=Streptomyces sp. NBC_01794 TaxID=2975942 RepID=UPI0030884207|nr:ABC transporter permease [Streptomyces sp. NBC_01794]WSB05169.1 ABC transporter permease [Streptomyces sp. NBC_01794]
MLASVAWGYVLWSLLPVLVTVQFSFNAGRSRSVWQGFSLRWYVSDPTASVLHDASLRLALTNSLRLALLTTLVTTPIGIALALGLARWKGRGSGLANGLMLLPLATPEIIMGSALYLVFANLYGFIPLGPTAQLLGHVTFSVAYVLVIARGRLASIGPHLEAAARDLGATPLQALRTVLLPQLTPAVIGSALVVFAASMDDFVISDFLSSDASSTTVPIKLYSAVRASPTPALNALAVLLLGASSLALLLAWLILRRRQDGASLRALTLP